MIARHMQHCASMSCSEIMAVLAMATSLQDMRNRLGAMVIGTSKARLHLCLSDQIIWLPTRTKSCVLSSYKSRLVDAGG